MKILRFILSSIVNVLFTSADPNLFGSRKRKKAAAKLANEFKKSAAETQGEIDILKTQNPFERASSKSAMASASRNAKQIQQRYANMMGGNASAESMVAAQSATQGAVAGTAGDIAVGSEALKAQEIANLRGQKGSQMGQYGQAKQSEINQIGSGWTTLFQGIDALGSAAGGAAGIMGAI